MPEGLTALAGLFARLERTALKESLPRDTRTPAPERGKVIAHEVKRRPVDRLAVRVMLPAPWWGKPMPPEKLVKPSLELLAAQNEVKTLRNEMGRLTREIGLLRAALRTEREATEKAKAAHNTAVDKWNAAEERLRKMEIYRQLNR